MMAGSCFRPFADEDQSEICMLPFIDPSDEGLKSFPTADYIGRVPQRVVIRLKYLPLE